MTRQEVKEPATSVRIGRLVLAAVSALLFVGLVAGAVTVLVIGEAGAAATFAILAGVALVCAVWMFRGSIHRSHRPATDPSAVPAELPARRTRSSAMDAWRQPETMLWVLAVGSLVVAVETSVTLGLALLLCAPLVSGGVARLSHARVWRLFTAPAAIAIFLGLIAASGEVPLEEAIPGVVAVAIGSFVALSSLTVLGYGLGWLAQRLGAGKTVLALAPATAEEAVGRELWRATDQLRAPAIEREYPVSPEGEDARLSDEAVLSSRGYHLVRVWKRPWGGDDDYVTIARFERS